MPQNQGNIPPGEFRPVTTISVPFVSAVLSVDPEHYRKLHDSCFYPFGEAGHKARNFYADSFSAWPYGNADDVLGSVPSQNAALPVNTAAPIISGGVALHLKPILTCNGGTFQGIDAT